MSERALGATVAGFASLLVLIGAFAMLRRRQLLAHTPTSRCAAVYMGWNEVRGRAYTDQPTTSHFTRLPCVYWHYKVEEERRSTRVVSSTDGNGNTHSRTETTYAWVTVEEAGQSVERFLVVDDSGSVAVSLRAARIEATRVVSRALGSRAFLGGDGPTGRTRETEDVIAVGEPVFACGDATLDPELVAPVLEGSDGGPFAVATGERGEDRVRGNFTFGGYALAGLGVALGGLSSALALSDERGIDGVDWVPGVAATTLVLFAAACVLAYNGLVRVRNRADRAWSLIEVMLQRRHDLIGQLVEVVRGYSAHEATLQTQLAAMRSGKPATVAEADTMGTAHAELAREVFARAEAYPDLVAGDVFARLQRAVADAEDRLSAAREFYDESVTAMHDRTHAFPGLVLARFGDFSDRPLFVAGSFTRSTPRVTIDMPAAPELPRT